MMKTRRLLDHPMFRQGLAMVLATQPDMNLVAPEMNGLEATVAIRNEYGGAKIIISLHTERRA